MSLSREWKLKALRRALGQETKAKGEERVFFCPKHPARSDRSIGQLSVNLTTDYFNCWSCGFSFKNLTPILRLIGDRSFVDEYVRDRQDSIAPKVEEKVYDRPRLPDEFISLSVEKRSPYRNAVVDYLRSRGLTQQEILLYKLGYCESGPYSKRVVIPSFDSRGELNFVTSRIIYDGTGERYQNGGNYDRDVIFNEYLVDWRRPVVITEGPFDAFAVGFNAVPLLGSIMDETKKLFRMIVTTGAEVYFAMDSDAMRKQLKLIELFMSYGVTSYHVDMGRDRRKKVDPSALGHVGIEQRLRTARPVRSRLDLALIRMGA